jgi:hypothetical protein
MATFRRAFRVPNGVVRPAALQVKALRSARSHAQRHVPGAKEFDDVVAAGAARRLRAAMQQRRAYLGGKGHGA